MSVTEQTHDGPMNDWFELSYAAYLVYPRSIIQEMPIVWQKRLVRLLDEANARFGGHLRGKSYTVYLRDERGRFVSDELRPYRHSSIEINPDQFSKLDVDDDPDFWKRAEE